MRIQIMTISGKKTVVTVKDDNMNALLGRLRGPSAWLEAADDKSFLINRDAIVSIREVSGAPEPE